MSRRFVNTDEIVSGINFFKRQSLQIISSAGNNTIYSSMTQKLRKERGQNLDSFISTFMHSIEQSSSTDIGEDVILMKEIKGETKKPRPPGQSPVFGNLFCMNSFCSLNCSIGEVRANKHSVRGPAQCLIYIRKLLVEIQSKCACLQHFSSLFSFRNFKCTKNSNSLHFGDNKTVSFTCRNIDKCSDSKAYLNCYISASLNNFVSIN